MRCRPKEFGGVSILVNNAGITRDNLLMRMKDEDWQAILDTNLTSGLSRIEGGDARHDEGAQGPHHQHRLGDRRDRQCRAGQLRRGQGRHHRLQQVAGEGNRLARDHGECVAPASSTPT
jgi:NAD(P)-dependent dehydrogenase (short-subunit alcohol dehydrogenase family)